MEIAEYFVVMCTLNYLKAENNSELAVFLAIFLSVVTNFSTELNFAIRWGIFNVSNIIIGLPTPIFNQRDRNTADYMRRFSFFPSLLLYTIDYLGSFTTNGVVAQVRKNDTVSNSLIATTVPVIMEKSRAFPNIIYSIVLLIICTIIIYFVQRWKSKINYSLAPFIFLFTSLFALRVAAMILLIYLSFIVSSVLNRQLIDVACWYEIACYFFEGAREYLAFIFFAMCFVLFAIIYLGLIMSEKDFSALRRKSRL